MGTNLGKHRGCCRAWRTAFNNSRKRRQSGDFSMSSRGQEHAGECHDVEGDQTSGVRISVFRRLEPWKLRVQWPSVLECREPPMIEHSGHRRTCSQLTAFTHSTYTLYLCSTSTQVRASLRFVTVYPICPSTQPVRRESLYSLLQWHHLGPLSLRPSIAAHTPSRGTWIFP